MKISKPLKVIIGLFTIFVAIFPFVIGPAFVMFFMLNSGFPFFNPQSTFDPEAFGRIFPMIFMVFYPAMMCFSFLQFSLQVFYIIHVIKNRQLTDLLRVLFALGAFFMPFIAMPIYFIAYFWKDNPLDSVAQQIEKPVS